MRFRRVPSFFAALVLAVTTSSSLVTQRLTHGAPATVVWSLAFMVAALLTWRASNPRDVKRHLRAQLAGASVGTVATHLGLVHGDAALVESLPQFTNDAVFVTVILAAVWVLRLGPGRRPIAVLPLLLLGAYAATARCWHVDHFPGSPVQDFVLQQSLAVLLGLLAFDVIWSQRETP